MDLTPVQLGVLAGTGLVVAVLALVLAVWSQLRLTRLRRSYRVLWPDGETDVATLVGDAYARIDRLERELAAGRAETALVRGAVSRSLRHVAVVRYDAFGDMGGRLSFSCAVVDDEGDGLVFSAIHARGESRTYAKGVVGGMSAVTLSPEEQQALSAARDDRRRPGAVATPDPPPSRGGAASVPGQG